jgi:hypothetical protein
MQAVLSELTLREIDRMSRKDLLEAYGGFTEVCRHQPSVRELDKVNDRELRQLVYQARRQYRARGY